MQEARDAEIAPVVGEHGVEVDLAVRQQHARDVELRRGGAALLERVAASVPARLSGATLVRANPQLRLYRYGPGERHGAHWTPSSSSPINVRSLLDARVLSQRGFTGGDETPELGRSIAPRRGRALLFQHRVLHEAGAVTAGEKLVLRTDVLYRGRALALSPPPPRARARLRVGAPHLDQISTLAHLDAPRSGRLRRELAAEVPAAVDARRARGATRCSPTRSRRSTP